MNRDDPESALDQDDSTSARAARAELQAGAAFQFFGSQTTSSRRLWDIWSHRHEVMFHTGVIRRPGLAEAVDRLRAAGTARIYLATITGSQRRFIVFLSEDLTRCAARV
ncbi:hypothetical protein ACUJ8H_32230 [Streptomyces sp. EKR5.2]|uniref:hypothetical protein n=1 Tax=Streptomyces sp. EKR5.2 TaxID=3461014 RepID=UPI004041EE67